MKRRRQKFFLKATTFFLNYTIVVVEYMLSISTYFKANLTFFYLSDPGNGMNYNTIHHRTSRTLREPNFRSKPQTFRIAEGDAARLPCFVDNLGK